MDFSLRADLVDRHRGFLAARTAESDKNIAFGVDGGVGDGMEIIRQLTAEDEPGRGLWALEVSTLTVFPGGSFRHADQNQLFRTDDDFPGGFPKRTVGRLAPFF